MLDIFTFDVITGSVITCVASLLLSKSYYETRFTKQIEKEKLALEAEQDITLTKRTKTMRAQIHKEFEDLTGISYEHFSRLMNSRDLLEAIAPYGRRVNAYIKRLEATNQKRMAQFRSKPITTAASERITEEHFGKPLSKLESLRREIELCKKKAEEVGIVAPVGTEPTPCEVVRVVDGDTFLVRVEDKSFRLRIMGFDTPEVCHPTKGFGHWGIQASAAAEKIISEGERFEVFLDKKSINEYNLYNDRYGRIIGHIKVDGELFGHKMLAAGNAEIVDFFPIEDAIITDYRRAEFSAKQENIGMWKEINEYRLMKKVKSAREAKYAFHDIVQTKRTSDYTKEMIRQIFIDLVGSSVTRSKRGGGKIHKHDCRYVRVIKDTENVELDEQWIEENADSLKPCRVCSGDDLIMEILG